MRFFILLIIGLAGCDTVLNKSYPASNFSTSQYYLVPVKMPGTLDKENCGAQALGTAAASLRPGGITFPKELLTAWQRDGATPLDVLLVARMDGFIAEVENSDWAKLMRTAQTDERPIVEFDSTIELWTPFGWFRRPRSQSVYHWDAVAGFARDGSAILLAAPGGKDYIIKHESFMRRWSRADDCLITIAAPP